MFSIFYMIVACLDERVGDVTGDSSNLWAQCFYLGCMLTAIAWLHWPDCMYLKPSLLLFAIFSQFGAQEMTCTLQGRTKQISISEHTCGLFKDLQRIVVWCILDCAQQNSLILWKWHFKKEMKGERVWTAAGGWTKTGGTPQQVVPLPGPSDYLPKTHKRLAIRRPGMVATLQVLRFLEKELKEEMWEPSSMKFHRHFTKRRDVEGTKVHQKRRGSSFQAPWIVPWVLLMAWGGRERQGTSFECDLHPDPLQITW